MVNDTISRQAVIDRINKQREHLQPDIYPQDKIGDAAYRICAEFIERFPSAQPEIVRCKDCENWIPGYITDNDDFIPPKCGKYQQMVGHSSDDYCSHAERRTDG